MADHALNAHEVFISHSYVNREIAEAVKAYLEKRGIRCWKAPEGIAPGERWAAAIAKAIRNTPIMVLIWTTSSMRSINVLNELTLADKHNKLVIPFRFEPISPSGEFEFYLSKMHWLDASSRDLDDDLNVLAHRIKVNLGSESRLASSVDCTDSTHSCINLGTPEKARSTAAQLVSAVES